MKRIHDPLIQLTNFTTQHLGLELPEAATIHVTERLHHLQGVLETILEYTNQQKGHRMIPDFEVIHTDEPYIVCSDCIPLRATKTQWGYVITADDIDPMSCDTLEEAQGWVNTCRDNGYELPNLEVVYAPLHFFDI